MEGEISFEIVLEEEKKMREIIKKCKECLGKIKVVWKMLWSVFLLKCEQTEEALQERLSYEQLLSRISVLAIEADDLSVFQNNCLTAMGKTLDVSRIYIFKHHHGTDTFDNVFEWVAEGVSRQKDELQGVNTADIPWWVEMLKSNQVISFADIEVIPDENVKTMLRSQQILSILDVPLFVAGQYYGFLGFDDCVSHRKWSDMNIELLQAVGRIITGVIERKQAEEKLLENEKKYRLLAENSADVIWTMNMNWEFTYFSPSIMKLRGYNPDEAIQIPLENICTPKSYKKAITVIMDEIARDGKLGITYDRSKTLELEQIRKDGSTVWTEVTTSFLRNKDRALTGILGITRNITKRKQAEEALKATNRQLDANNRQLRGTERQLRAANKQIKEHKNRLELAMDAGEHGFWDWNLKTDDIYFSPRYYTMLGYEDKELPMRKETWTGLMHPEDRRTIVPKITKHVENAEPYEAEFRLKCKNGTWKWISGKGKSFEINGKGKPLRAVGVHLDITERKQAEESLLRLQKLESLGVLAGGIAHDFNNLLVGIMGNTSIALLNKNNPKKQDELLQKVITASEKATSLTQQLLTFAKGGIPSKKIASIAEVVEESVNLALGQSSSVKCELTLPEDLWMMEIDVDQIDQVFQNLIINAKQAMPEGGVIQIRAENVEMTSSNSYHFVPGNFVHIIFKDSGIGIPKKYLQKIFDPYFSTKDSKKEQGGSGLGLAVSHSVIQKHGGCIYANSKQGKGTTFHIYLSADRNAVLKKESVEESSKTTKSLKILVMDDNQMVLDLMKDILGNLGHQFILSEHGAEAVEKYQEAFGSETPFDMVILDLTIPGGMGGVETLEELKKLDPNVKAIISSGYSEQVPNGFAGVLSKPYKIKDLMKVLEEVIMWS
ncbi:MAG: PAS domain S-box protein [Patescibacteria group bacterium]|nr:PAS domain S-box protein [Patescibacteria group bacterium]